MGTDTETDQYQYPPKIPIPPEKTDIHPDSPSLLNTDTFHNKISRFQVIPIPNRYKEPQPTSISRI